MRDRSTTFGEPAFLPLCDSQLGGRVKRDPLPICDDRCVRRGFLIVLHRSLHPAAPAVSPIRNDRLVSKVHSDSLSFGAGEAGGGEGGGGGGGAGRGFSFRYAMPVASRGGFLIAFPRSRHTAAPAVSPIRNDRRAT